MKLSGKIFGAVLAGAMLAGAAAEAQEMKFFRIGTGSAGGTYFPIGGIIANGISNPPGSRPCDKGGTCGVPGLVAIAQSTNASAHNVTAINAGQMEAGLTGAATLYFAYHGEAKFKGKQKPKLRVIANLFPEDLHLVLPKGRKLGSLKDLKGKRVGIAQAGSGTQIAVEIILGEQGINRGNIDEAELNNSQSAERIADGQLDAYFYAAGTPVAAMIQLDNTKGMELYSFSDAEVKASNKAVPYYVPSTIKAGTYPGVQYDVNTLSRRISSTRSPRPCGTRPRASCSTTVTPRARSSGWRPRSRASMASRCRCIRVPRSTIRKSASLTDRGLS